MNDLYTKQIIQNSVEIPISSIKSKNNNSINNLIIDQLKEKFGNKCIKEGFVEKDSIDVVHDSLRINSDFIDNRIKSEIAGTIWGKDEAANIRLQMDNQIIETLKHFNEADAFLESLN